MTSRMFGMGHTRAQGTAVSHPIPWSGREEARSETGLLRLDARQTVGMRGARGSEVALPASRFIQCAKPDPVPRARQQKLAGGLSLRLSVGNHQFREAAPYPRQPKNSVRSPAYLTGALTGGGKGSA